MAGVWACRSCGAGVASESARVDGPWAVLGSGANFFTDTSRLAVDVRGGSWGALRVGAVECARAVRWAPAACPACATQLGLVKDQVDRACLPPASLAVFGANVGHALLSLGRVELLPGGARGVAPPAHATGADGVGDARAPELRGRLRRLFRAAGCARAAVCAVVDGETVLLLGYSGATGELADAGAAAGGGAGAATGGGGPGGAAGEGGRTAGQRAATALPAAATATATATTAAAGTAAAASGGAGGQCDAPFELCSVTKYFVADAFQRLALAGAVDLSATAGSLLGVPVAGGTPAHGVTLAQLLSHTSGLPDHLGPGAPLRVHAPPAACSSCRTPAGLP